MKFRSVLWLFLMASPVLLFSQSGLESIKQAQHDLNRTGMIILGSWAVSNIGIGFYRSTQTTGPRKYFNQMNGLWNTVNLGLATAGFFTVNQYLKAQSLSEVLTNQANLEKIFLVNGALDVAYITAGFFLIERSKNVVKNSDRFNGYGKGLILQGGFLLLFDGIMYVLHHTNQSTLTEIVNQLAFQFDSSGAMTLGLSMKF